MPYEALESRIKKIPEEYFGQVAQLLDNFMRQNRIAEKISFAEKLNALRLSGSAWGEDAQEYVSKSRLEREF